MKITYVIGLLLGIVVGFSHSTLLNTAIGSGAIKINIIDILMFILILLAIKESRKNILEKKILYICIMFSVITLISLCIGLQNNYDIHLVIRDFRYITYFILIIIIVNLLVKTADDIRTINNIVFIISFIGIIQILFNAKNSIDSYQDILQIKTLSIPFTACIISASNFFASFGKWNKLIYVPSFILILIATILTMIRNVWLSVLLIIIMNVFYLIKHGIMKKRYVFLLLASTFIMIMFSYEIILKPKLEYTVNNYYNDTLYFRFHDALSLYDYVRGNVNILTGAGLGADASIYVLGGNGTLQLSDDYYTENSYLFYYWKMGLPALILLLYLIVIRLIKLCKYRFQDIQIYNILAVYIIYIMFLAFSGGISQVEQIFYFAYLTGINVDNVRRLEDDKSSVTDNCGDCK